MRIVLLIMFCLVSVSNYATDTSSLIDTTDMDKSTVWYSTSYIGRFGDGECELKLDITKVMRDTVIDDRLCRIIGVTSDGIYLPESEVVLYSKASKMYFHEDDKWKLLYDFAAKVGDTVTYYISKKYPYYFKYAVPSDFYQEEKVNEPHKLIINKVDTILASGNIPLRRFHTKRVAELFTNNMDLIVENVGSMLKLFGNSTIIVPPECLDTFPSLLCFSNDDFSFQFTNQSCNQPYSNSTSVPLQDRLWVVDYDNWQNIEKSIRYYYFADTSTFLNGKPYYELLSNKFDQPTILRKEKQFFRLDGKKLIHYVNNAEVAFEDFSLIIGDTMKYWGGPFPSADFIITRIDTIVLLDGKPRLQYTYQCFQPDSEPGQYHTLTEGLSDQNSLFGQMQTCSLWDPPYYRGIRCYYEKGELIYRRQELSDCLISGTNDIEVNTFVITPNPASTHIKIAHDIFIEIEYTIFDFSGKAVQTGSTLNNNEVDISHLTDGMYFIKVMEKDGKISAGRWVKM